MNYLKNIKKCYVSEPSDYCKKVETDYFASCETIKMSQDKN